MVGAAACIDVDGADMVMDLLFSGLVLFDGPHVFAEEGAVEDFEEVVDSKDAAVPFFVGLVECPVVEGDLLGQIWLLLAIFLVFGLDAPNQLLAFHQELVLSIGKYFPAPQHNSLLFESKFGIILRGLLIHIVEYCLLVGPSVPNVWLALHLLELLLELILIPLFDA